MDVVGIETIGSIAVEHSVLFQQSRLRLRAYLQTIQHEMAAHAIQHPESEAAQKSLELVTRLLVDDTQTVLADSAAVIARYKGAVAEAQLVALAAMADETGDKN